MEVVKKVFSKNKNLIQLIKCPAIGKVSKNILIIGVFHGEEPQGKFLIEEYLKEKRDLQFKNNMFFIPCLNPDGLAINTRQNANGIDLNRNFPTINWKKVENTSDYYGGESSASENETKFIMEIIKELSPDVILTLHAPYKVVNYDGPAGEIAKEISKIIDYPTSNDIGYPTPGSFGNYAGVERKIPTITLEVDEDIDVENLKKPVFKIFEYLGKY